MRLMKGKVMLEPIIDPVSSHLVIEQRKVTRAKVVQAGECDELTEGMTVLLSGIQLKAFTESPNGMLVMDEDEILAVL